MVNSFNRLWHNTIVSRHNQHSNIRNLSAARTHWSKGFMTRSIQECDFASLNTNLISANMLGNTACLSWCYTRIADCVQKWSFAMVNMTHNRYYRRTFFHIARIIQIIFQNFNNSFLTNFNLHAKFISQQNCRIRLQILVNRGHNTHFKQFFNQLAGRFMHALSQFRENNRFTDNHFFRCSRSNFYLLAFLLLILITRPIFASFFKAIYTFLIKFLFFLCFASTFFLWTATVWFGRSRRRSINNLGSGRRRFTALITLAPVTSGIIRTFIIKTLIIPIIISAIIIVIDTVITTGVISIALTIIPFITASAIITIFSVFFIIAIIAFTIIFFVIIPISIFLIIPTIIFASRLLFGLGTSSSLMHSFIFFNRSILRRCIRLLGSIRHSLTVLDIFSRLSQFFSICGFSFNRLFLNRRLRHFFRHSNCLVRQFGGFLLGLLRFWLLMHSFCRSSFYFRFNWLGCCFHFRSCRLF